jgi:hypothetical protein
MRKLYAVLAAAVLLAACGGPERREAASLCKVLSQKQSDLVAINNLEKDLMGSVRPWCDGIINNGGGKGEELRQNAESAKTMAFSASEVANQIGHLRQAIYDLPLHQEYPQTVRSALINQMMLRQKKLQEVRLKLEESSAGFLDLARSTAYKGDSYPPAIDKLNSLTSGYVMPEDALAKAIGELKVKYTLKDVDLAGRT